MKILITGANGFIGRSLCAELCWHRHKVVAAVRSASIQIDNVELMVIGSINSKTDWSSALCHVDVVIHLAARVHVLNDCAINPLMEFRNVNVDSTLNLAQQAVGANVKRFIYISSIGVNGNATIFGQPFTAEDKPHPHDPYSVSKYEAEQGLLKLASQTGLEVVIIRPPLVYGYGALGNFARLVNALNKGIPLPLSNIHNKRSFVFVGNLVSLIVRCINHPAAANQVFLVSDGDDLSTTQLLRGCAKVLGVKPRLVPIPQKLIEIFAALVGKKSVAQRLCGNLQVDITKARTLLDWNPPITVEEGLKATGMGFNKVDK